MQYCFGPVKINVGKGKIATGTNCIPCSHNSVPSTHAEISAINKIKTYKNVPKALDLLVVQITKAGKLSNSRPCYDCICALEAECSNIIIRNVYYSTPDGTIAKEKLKDMKNSPLTYVSYGHKNKKKLS